MQNDKRLADLIHLAYRAAIDPSGWPVFLRRFAGFLDSRSSCLSTFDFGSHVGEIRSAVGFDPEYVHTYRSRYAPLNPWLRKEELYRRPGAIVTGREVVNHGELVKTEFYNGWLKPQELFHRVSGVVARENHRLTYFEVLRPQGLKVFGRHEVALFGRLVPHLQQALQIQGVMGSLRVERDAMVDTLDRLPFGVFVVDRGCKPLRANSYAKELLAAADGLTLGRNGLCAGSHSESESLRELVASAAAMAVGGVIEPDGVLTLSRPSGRRPFQVLVAFLPDTHGFLDDEAPVAVLLVSDPERRVDANEDRLCRLYRLTQAEARLAGLMAQGKRLDGMAETTGVSVHTVRTHLKRIFTKTGTSSQAELVHLLLAGTGQIRSH